MPEETDKRHEFLFVDDDPQFLATVTQSKQSSKAHWAFRTATNHLQALEQLKAQPVEIIVLDIEMPVMDGIEFLRLLRQAHPGQRVVMLSPRVGDEAARKTSMELGAVLYLEKPRTPEGFQCLFAALEALTTTGAQSGFRGVMQVGLHDVLQMECLGRKSSILGVSAGSRMPCARASSSIVAGRRQPSRCTCSSAFGQVRSASFVRRGVPWRALTTTRKMAPPSPTGSPASTGRPTPSVT